MEFISARLVNEESRRKEKVLCKEEATFYSRNNGIKLSHGNRTVQNTKTCFYCGKSGHFKAYCRKRQMDNMNSEKAHTALLNGSEQLFSMQDKQRDTLDVWYVDSGATQHMTNRREWFNTLTTILPKKVYMGDSTAHDATAKGDILITLQDVAPSE